VLKLGVQELLVPLVRGEEVSLGWGDGGHLGAGGRGAGTSEGKLGGDAVRVRTWVYVRQGRRK